MKAKSKQVKEKNKQLELGLHTPFGNFFINIRNRIVSRMVFFEANRFINDPFIWFYSSLMSIGAIYQIVFITNHINSLPNIVPIFNSTTIPKLMLAPKLYLFIIPLISLSIFLFTFKTAKANYYKNYNLSLFILFISTLVVIILSLHIIKVLIPYV